MRTNKKDALVTEYLRLKAKVCENVVLNTPNKYIFNHIKSMYTMKELQGMVEYLSEQEKMLDSMCDLKSFLEKKIAYAIGGCHKICIVVDVVNNHLTITINYDNEYISIKYDSENINVQIGTFGENGIDPIKETSQTLFVLLKDLFGDNSFLKELRDNMDIEISKVA